MRGFMVGGADLESEALAQNMARLKPSFPLFGCKHVDSECADFFNGGYSPISFLNSGVNTPFPKMPIGICGIDGFSLARFWA